jgi:hypothetical protein
MIAATESVSAIMDILVWLRSLGLEEYEAAFRQNKINDRVLPRLRHMRSKHVLRRPKVIYKRMRRAPR